MKEKNTPPNPPMIHGLDLDEQTRCQHWHSPLDIIAIKFACCQEYYACYDCHAALAGHEAKPWPKEVQATEKAIICGNCKYEMTILEYKKANSICPNCKAQFNPRCELHWHLYFD